jgi:hypothetical protein
MLEFRRCRQGSWQFFFGPAMAVAAQEFSLVRTEATICGKKLPLSLEALHFTYGKRPVYERNQDGLTLAPRTSYSSKGDIS